MAAASLISLANEALDFSRLLVLLLSALPMVLSGTVVNRNFRALSAQ